MFETAEIGSQLSDDAFKQLMPGLREGLLTAQYEMLNRARTEVVIILAGVNGSGRSETAHAIGEWLDPRHIAVVPDLAPTDEERCRPPMWRYWRALPAKGRIGMFFSAWYGALLGRHKLPEDGALNGEFAAINRFEQMLVDEGALVVKFWFHLSQRDQKRRLESLAADRKTHWRVTKDDWAQLKHYDTVRTLAERMVGGTSTAAAPWFVVESGDRNFREATVAETLLREFDRMVVQPPPTPTPVKTAVALKPRANGGQATILDTLDLTLALDKGAYEDALVTLQARLAKAVRRKRFQRHAAVAVFEGYDAAGKGGAIRRVTMALDPRRFAVVPVGAPNDEERGHPYLWRFWRHVPSSGRLTLFDRSWYGRVLVERVEGLCSEADWRRAYGEINAFEEELHDAGIAVVKFFLVVSPREQLRRFRERQTTGFKRYKITADDWRNRRRRPQYDSAIVEMIERCSTELAPWTLVEGDDKRYARIKILRTLVESIERRCR